MWQVSRERVEADDLKDIIAVGEDVYVKVTSIDEANSKYSLSMKLCSQARAHRHRRRRHSARRAARAHGREAILEATPAPPRAPLRPRSETAPTSTRRTPRPSATPAARHATRALLLPCSPLRLGTSRCMSIFSSSSGRGPRGGDDGARASMASMQA